MENVWEITREAELSSVVETVLEELQKVDNEAGAPVLALHGDLGAGKTSFMQTLARELGVSDDVTSPTFVVMKLYELIEQPWARLVHMDAYRLESIDELGPLRFAELLEQKNNLIAIEWAEKIATALPKRTLHLNFTITGDTRQLTLRDHG